MFILLSRTIKKLPSSGIFYAASLLQNFRRFMVSRNLVYDYLLCFHNLFMMLCGNWNIVWIIEKLSSCNRIVWRHLFLVRPKLLLAREKCLHFKSSNMDKCNLCCNYLSTLATVTIYQLLLHYNYHCNVCCNYLSTLAAR